MKITIEPERELDEKFESAEYCGLASSVVVAIRHDGTRIRHAHALHEGADPLALIGELFIMIELFRDVRSKLVTPEPEPEPSEYDLAN
jgi:hypothetical protein